MVRTVQRILGTFLAVIQNHVKTAACGNNQLTQVTMSVPTTGRSTGNVIQLIHALDIEGHQFAPLDHTQVTPLVVGNRDINQTRFF